MRKVIKGLLFAVGVAALAVPAAIASAGTSPDGETTPFVVGGNDATETYSFMAALSSSEGWGCGASLIRPTWIVTAKHCVTGDNDQPSAPSTLSFRIGSLSQSSGGTVAKAKRVIRYDAGDADAALVELTAPVTVKPINVATTAPIGTSTRIIGWGCRSDACDTPSNGMLQQLDTSILPDSACGGGEYDLCINNVDGWRGACYGDSGGPTVIKVGGEWALVGATSGGTGKCGENPSFYVDLPHLRSWIVSNAGPDAGGTPDPPAATNLALSRPATSNQAACASAEGTAKAVNGSTTGGRSDKWCAGGSATKSIEIDLGADKALTKLVVKHAAAGGEPAIYNTKNFVLETSAGDGTWKTVVTIADNTAATTTHPVNLTARRIRLTTTDPIARIYEIEAY